jgi:hypothetical protein
MKAGKTFSYPHGAEPLLEKFRRRRRSPSPLLLPLLLLPNMKIFIDFRLCN